MNNTIRDGKKIKFEPNSSPNLVESKNRSLPLRNHIMPSIFSNLLSKVKPDDFEINTKISPRTNHVFNLLNENIQELITYHTQLKTTPASKNLLSALDEFRRYALETPDRQLLYEITNISKLPFKIPGEMDYIDQHINPYETYTNTQYNMDLIKFLQSIRNYKSVEEYLYKMPA
jgi:hypothetical protein